MAAIATQAAPQHAQQDRGIVMSSQLARAIRSSLHPDREVGNPKERKRLEDLSQEFNSFKIAPPAPNERPQTAATSREANGRE